MNDASSNTNVVSILDIFDSPIGGWIVKFLGFYDSIKIFVLIHKRCQKVVLDSFFANNDDVKKARLSIPSAQAVSNILDICRSITFGREFVKLPPAAGNVLRKIQDMSVLRHPELYVDFATLCIGVYANWGKSLNSPSKGVFHHFAQNYKHVEFFENPIKNDLPYWQNTRISNRFIVLFDRPDGTIIVTEDFRHVYLVAGLFLSIADDLQLNFITPMKEIHDYTFHGAVIGVKCFLTLLNWENKIVYDGTFVPLEYVSPIHMQRAYQAYLQTMQKGTIITQLTKEPIGFDVTLDDAPSSSSGPASVPSSFSSTETKYIDGEDIELTHNELIEYECTRMSTRSILKKIEYAECNTMREIHTIVVFRRFGYSERDNPENKIGLLIGGTKPLFAERTLTILPTPSEYLKMIMKMIDMLREKPRYIAIDAIEHLNVMRQLLKPAEIYIRYLPPPLEEEKIFNNMLIPHCTYYRCISAMQKFCASCGLIPSDDSNNTNTDVIPNTTVDTTTTKKNIPVTARSKKLAAATVIVAPVETKKLLACGRCQNVYYCCKEHQKSHWREHKNRCGIVGIKST